MVCTVWVYKENGARGNYNHSHCFTWSPTFGVTTFLTFSSSSGGRWYLTAVLICVSLLTNRAVYSVLCLLAICISSFGILCVNLLPSFYCVMSLFVIEV